MSIQHRASSHVVILGGGITGLSAAFHLARKHPTVQITLFEKDDRFGGWVRSERVNVYDSDGNRGSVLLEAGPRTIRPNAKSVLQLIQLLDLRSEVICTPRGSPAARNRFLYIPPTRGLQPLPSGLLSLFTLPLGRLVLKSVLAEPFIPANRPQKKSPQPASPPPPPAGSASQKAPTTITTTTTTRGATEAVEEDESDDESVDSFLSRRFGDAFARTLGSALVHGIYAADSRVLSVRAAFPVLRESEARGKGSVVWGELGPPAWFGGGRPNAKVSAEEEEEGVDREWEAHFRTSAALFSFKEGMETLVRALVEALRGFPNVTLRCGAVVRGIDTTEDGDCGSGDRDHDDRRLSFQIYLGAEDGIRDKVADSDVDKTTTSVRATHIISAVPLPALDSILQSRAVATAGTHATTTTLPHLRANPHSSVTVLNLVLPNPQGTETKPLHPPGFGYLIPRPEDGCPPSSAPGSEPEPGSGSESGTEREERSRSEGLGLLGVVFDTACLPEQDEDAVTTTATATTFTKLTAMLGGPYPLAHSSSDAKLVAAVLPRIAAHLGRDLPPPVHYAVHRNEGSIPTYLVGHTARMEELRQAVRERWGGRMKIIGAGVGGVSVADCVQSGRHAAYEIGKQIGD